PRDGGGGTHGGNMSRGPGMHPFRQEGVRVEARRAVELDAALVEELLQALVAPSVERLRTAADMDAADEDLRDGRRADAGLERGAHLATPVALLVSDGIEVDGAVGDAGGGEHPAHRPGELAPFER